MFVDEQGNVFIDRGHMQGTIECVPGVRVALMAPGDKQWRRCFEYLATGTVEGVIHRPFSVWDSAKRKTVNTGPTLIRVRMDETTPLGPVIEVYPDAITALG